MNILFCAAQLSKVMPARRHGRQPGSRTGDQAGAIDEGNVTVAPGLHLRRPMAAKIAALFAFSIIAFLVMGYHPGLEDDGVYLSAVNSDLNPALYPHDAQFFRIQLQATLFDKLIAGFVRSTGVSVALAELLWQFASIALIVVACWSISRRLFPEEHAHWAGVALVSAMLTLPVAGSALNLADQHLHPRNPATGLILLAADRVLARRRWQAIPLLAAALVLHPIMASLGISFCVFLTLATTVRFASIPRCSGAALSVAAPLGWIFEPPSNSWYAALNTRRYYFIFRWTWYEWLGALAPLLLFWLLWRFARKRGEDLLARCALAVFAYGVFQQTVALVMALTPALIRFTPLQPMRYLQLVYFFMVLIGGCLMGRYLLKASWVRWAIFLLAINSGMFLSQRAEFSTSPHLELPWVTSSNPWLQAFAWIRENTPADAFFAADPNYLAAPGEDYHSFRALAERSVMADAIKDAAMVTQVPELGPVWQKQVDAATGWQHFTAADFERLKTRFGVNWVLVSYPQPEGLDCRWHNGTVAVCRIP